MTSELTPQEQARVQDICSHLERQMLEEALEKYAIEEIKKRIDEKHKALVEKFEEWKPRIDAHLQKKLDRFREIVELYERRAKEKHEKIVDELMDMREMCFCQDEAEDEAGPASFC
ncbi:hypothetical protein L596_010170 [Steinernema carpocapsae]|uniref:Uncharacterized protein n=1 Tax=Steinernema carpocapsae TaxID=34508 RepID=A0A4V6A6T8_STECR|nr:hypothetical protein L596_010170 [Steinernema carpocapsae]